MRVLPYNEYNRKDIAMEMQRKISYLYIRGTTEETSYYVETDNTIARIEPDYDPINDSLWFDVYDHNNNIILRVNSIFVTVIGYL